MRYNFYIIIILAVLILELIIKINPLIGALLSFAGVLIVLGIASKMDYMLEDKKQIMLLAAGIVAVKTTLLFLPLNYFYKTLFSYLMFSFLAVYYAYESAQVNKNLKFKTVLWGVSVAIILAHSGMILAGIEDKWIFFLIPLIAFSEECLFRRLFFEHLEKREGVLFAAIFTSMLYAVFAINLGFFSALFFFSMSLVFSLFYFKTRSLLFTMALNALVHMFLVIG